MFYGEVFKALNKAKIKYIVAGGVAVVLHGFTRYTNDLDLIVKLEEENLDKFFDVLYKVGFRPKAPVTKEQFKDKRQRQQWIKEKGMVVFSFFHISDPLKFIDMFVKEPIRFEDLDRKKVKVRYKKITVPIISIDDLKILKKKANRLKDQEDIVQLNFIKKFKKK